MDLKPWVRGWEVLHTCAAIPREHPWEVTPELYFYKVPEENERKRRPLMKDYDQGASSDISGERKLLSKLSPLLK